MARRPDQAQRWNFDQGERRPARPDRLAELLPQMPATLEGGSLAAGSLCWRFRGGAATIAFGHSRAQWPGWFCCIGRKEAAQTHNQSQHLRCLGCTSPPDRWPVVSQHHQSCTNSQTSIQRCLRLGWTKRVSQSKAAPNWFGEGNVAVSEQVLDSTKPALPFFDPASDG